MSQVPSRTTSVGGAVRHRLEERRPPASLAGLVASVYVNQLAPDAPDYVDVVIPSGSVELRCRVGGTPEVIGPLSRPQPQTMSPGTTVVGIKFRAGAAASVLGLPLSEIVDHTVPLGDLSGRASASLISQLAESLSPTDTLSGLQLLVETRLAEAPVADPLVRQVVKELMPWRAGDLASLRTDLGISERQLRRRCHASIGLGPKVLQRMLRFQGFLALGHEVAAEYSHGDGAGLAGLAVEAGYADQSHLTRECVRLTNETPSALLHELARDCVGHDHGAWYEPLVAERWASQAKRGGRLA